MQIDSLELFHVALPLRRPLATPCGEQTALHTVLACMHSGGQTGWGEASPGNAPLDSEEWAGGVFATLRDCLAPAVAGRTIESGEALQKRLAPFRGNRYAKSALDNAWWDLEARLQQKPLHRLLGGERDAVAVGPTFDQMDTIDDLLAALHDAAQAGYSRVGLKFRPGWDVQMLNFVRHEFPTLAIHIDCEGALQLEQMEMLCRLDDFSLAMIEQPLSADDLVGHAMIHETIRTPICLDEGVCTLERTEIALELHACQFVKIEPGRVGGLSVASNIYEMCHENCTPCWIGGVPQSAIGTRHGLALATRANCTYPADYLPMGQLLETDLAEPLVPTLDTADNVQRVVLPAAPGIGVEPQRAVLEKLSLNRVQLP